MTLPPWDYLFLAFSRHNFHDLYDPTWVAALFFFVITVVLYNVRTRQLRRHGPFLSLYEWLLWTGLIFFPLVVIGALFEFDFFIVLSTVVIGVGTLLWIRLVRFPPLLAAYEKQLAKGRYLSLRKFAHPEATIRPRASRQSRARRRRH